MLSLVDLAGRASIQESFLAIQVEEATAIAVGVAQNTTAAKASTTEEATTAKEGSHRDGDTQENEKQDRVAAEDAQTLVFDRLLAGMQLPTRPSMPLDISYA